MVSVTKKIDWLVVRPKLRVCYCWMLCLQCFYVLLAEQRGGDPACKNLSTSCWMLTAPSMFAVRPSKTGGKSGAGGKSTHDLCHHVFSCSEVSCRCSDAAVVSTLSPMHSAVGAMSSDDSAVGVSATAPSSVMSSGTWCTFSHTAQCIHITYYTPLLNICDLSDGIIIRDWIDLFICNGCSTSDGHLTTSKVVNYIVNYFLQKVV